MTQETRRRTRSTALPTGQCSTRPGRAEATPGPIQSLRETLKNLEHGDFSVPLDVRSSDPDWQDLTQQIQQAARGAQDAIDEADAARHEAATLRDAALAAAASETRFLTNVSHELRTPLASVRAAAEILSQYPDEPMTTKQEFLDMILQGAGALEDLLDQILDLSRIQAGRIHWDLKPTDPGITLRQATAVFHPAAAKDGVTITLDIARDLPTVAADPERLKQLWINLIDNAMKFRGDSDTIQVRAFLDGSEAVVEIEDQGVGIREADQEAIFQRFYQGQHDLTDKPSGTGLGLSIAREIVMSHGGRIDVESEPGLGTTLRVCIPRL